MSEYLVAHLHGCNSSCWLVSFMAVKLASYQPGTEGGEVTTFTLTSAVHDACRGLQTLWTDRPAASGMQQSCSNLLANSTDLAPRRAVTHANKQCVHAGKGACHRYAAYYRNPRTAQ